MTAEDKEIPVGTPAPVGKTENYEKVLDDTPKKKEIGCCARLCMKLMTKMYPA